MKTICNAALLGLVMTLTACSNLPVENADKRPAATTPDTPAQTADSQSQAQTLKQSTNKYQRAKTPLPPELKAQLVSIQQAIQDEQLADAARQLATLMAQPQRSAAMYVLQGDYALASGDSDKALNHYRQALSANPYTYYAHNRLAAILREKGRFDEALMHYNRALDAWAGYAPAYRNRGILYDLYLGDKQAALDDYQQYQQLQQLSEDDFDSSRPGRQINAWIADLKRQLTSTGDTA
ncbi:tetratricopeptide repeat protein [Alteromonas sp. ASW11-19]|uniref:Tetratricopeptide repeat protein n=1 Tax=Alteromonas salexigens TaxID=2982530 RepID=A0ABT2VRZ0_9ALTE|nr:tetratricopeptide repeat protein [Alteromonas salexigens]MCU7556056.1 tetratricopeptide repeat protein [Alteromonas salexigens]